MEVKKIILTIKNDSPNISACIRYSDDSEEEKEITYNRLIEVINYSTLEAEYIRIGDLPVGYVDSSIGTKGNSFNVIVRVPANIRIMSYFGDNYLIPFPETVFFLRAKKGELQAGCSVFAIRESERNESNIQLYNYPFGNVYSEGEICWGNISFPYIENMKAAEKCIALFYEAETNDDLYQVGKNVVKQMEFVHQRGLIEALRDKDKFPDEWLVPAQRTLSGYSKNWLKY